MRCPFAEWRGDGVPNETRGGMIAHRFVIAHVQQGLEAGTDSWFRNPAAQASAHFGIANGQDAYPDGHLQQWVDTDDMAWAEAAGNPLCISVEVAGFSGQPMTAKQLATFGRLFAWAIAVYPTIPAVVTDDPNGAGLGWHGMGGQAWGGHLDCPGDPIKAQRPAILALAGGKPPAPNPNPISSAGKDNMLAGDPTSGGTWFARPDGSVYNDSGSPYLGGLNSHPEWTAPGTGTVAGIAPWKDAQGLWGYDIVVEHGDPKGPAHYRFPRNGQYRTKLEPTDEPTDEPAAEAAAEASPEPEAPQP